MFKRLKEKGENKIMSITSTFLPDTFTYLLTWRIDEGTWFPEIKPVEWSNTCVRKFKK